MTFFEDIFSALKTGVNVAGGLGIIPAPVQAVLQATGVIAAPKLPPAPPSPPNLGAIPAPTAGLALPKASTPFLPTSTKFGLPGINFPYETGSEGGGDEPPLDPTEPYEAQTSGRVTAGPPADTNTLHPYMTNTWERLLQEDNVDWFAEQPFLTAPIATVKRVIFPAHEANADSKALMLDTNWLEDQSREGRSKTPIPLADVRQEAANPVLDTTIGASPIELPLPANRLQVHRFPAPGVSMKQMKALFGARNPKK